VWYVEVLYNSHDWPHTCSTIVLILQFLRSVELLKDLHGNLLWQTRLEKTVTVDRSTSCFELSKLIDNTAGCFRAKVVGEFLGCEGFNFSLELSDPMIDRSQTNYGGSIY